MPGPGAVSAGPESVHASGAGQQEGPHRVVREAAGAEPQAHGPGGEALREDREEAEGADGRLSGTGEGAQQAAGGNVRPGGPAANWIVDVPVPGRAGGAGDEQAVGGVYTCVWLGCIGHW